MVISVFMRNNFSSMFCFLRDYLEFSFKSSNPSNISIIDVNVNEEEIDFEEVFEIQ